MKRRCRHKNREADLSSPDPWGWYPVRCKDCDSYLGETNAECGFVAKKLIWRP